MNTYHLLQSFKRSSRLLLNLGWTFALALLLLLPAHTAQAQKKQSSSTRSNANRSIQNDATQTLVRASLGTPDMRTDLDDAWSVCDTMLSREICAALIPAQTLRNVSSRGGKATAFPNVSIFGSRQSDGFFEVRWILCDSLAFTKSHVEARMNKSLLSRIAKPFEQRILNKETGKDTTIPYYCHSILSPLQQIGRIMQMGTFLDVSLKQALLRLSNYAYSNISLFEADYSATRRLREVLTPPLPRTSALETAEQECANTEDIKKKISKGQPVSQALIDEGGSPNACETVKIYYSKMASLEQIGKVYIVTKRYTEGEKPEILGIVSIPPPSSLQAADPNFLRNALLSPLSVGTLTAAELSAMKTKEFVRDDSTGVMVSVKGSIEWTSSETMLDYLSESIRQNANEKIGLLRSSSFWIWNGNQFFNGFRARLRRELDDENRK